MHASHARCESLCSDCRSTVVSFSISSGHSTGSVLTVDLLKSRPRASILAPATFLREQKPVVLAPARYSTVGDRYVRSVGQRIRGRAAAADLETFKPRRIAGRCPAAGAAAPRARSALPPRKLLRAWPGSTTTCFHSLSDWHRMLLQVLKSEICYSAY